MATERLGMRYIAVNITVCVLCVLSIISLFFFPLLRVDVGKVLRSDATIELVDKKIAESVGGSLEGSSQEGVDYVPVVSAVVKNVLKKSKGSLSLNGVTAAKVAFSSEDNATKVVLDELTGEGGLVSELIDSVVDGVSELFETDEGRDLIENTLVSALVTTYVRGAGANVSQDDIRTLTNVFRDIEKVEDGNIAPVINNFVEALGNVVGEEIPAEERSDVADHIQEMYDMAKTETGKTNVTFEELISVSISSSVDLSKFNISNLIGGLMGGDSSDADDEFDNVAFRLNEEPASEEEEEESYTVVSSYSEMLELMGFGTAEMDTLKAELKADLNSEMTDLLSDYGSYFKYYGYVFYVVLGFSALWLIQFVFALVHIFTKNKAFRCWYTKAFCWIPALIWLALLIAPMILNKVAPDMLSGGLIGVIMAGVGSFTWVTGLCYLLVWLASTVLVLILRVAGKD